MIETKRLYLREMTPDDFDALYAVLADSDIMQHYPYTFDEARVQNWINKNIERYRVFGFGLWAVCLKTTGEMCGTIPTREMAENTRRSKRETISRYDSDMGSYRRCLWPKSTTT